MFNFPRLLPVTTILSTLSKFEQSLPPARALTKKGQIEEYSNWQGRINFAALDAPLSASNEMTLESFELSGAVT
jgi:hypothetical protein